MFVPREEHEKKNISDFGTFLKFYILYVHILFVNNDNNNKQRD